MTDRKPRLTMVQRTEVMNRIRQADAKTPDLELARALTIELGATVSRSMVTSYRKQLDIESVPMPSRAELAEQNAQLQQQILDLQNKEA